VKENPTEIIKIIKDEPDFNDIIIAYIKDNPNDFKWVLYIQP